MKLLVIDIGGRNVKVWNEDLTEAIKCPSGPDFTPKKLMKRLTGMIDVSAFDRISVGYPEVWDNRPSAEPLNLGAGWVDFDFAKELDRPVRILNDAALQALGSYEGGRMLYIGLGTGVGTVMILDGLIIPIAPAALRLNDKRRLGWSLTREGLKELGLERWQANVREAAAGLRHALQVDYVVLGGGNAKKLQQTPEGCRMGGNHLAFRGGERMWTWKNHTDLPAWMVTQSSSTSEQPELSNDQADAGRKITTPCG